MAERLNWTELKDFILPENYMEIIEYIKQKPDVIRFVLRRLCLVEMNLLEIKNECGEPSQETKKDAWGLLLFFSYSLILSIFFWLSALSLDQYTFV